MISDSYTHLFFGQTSSTGYPRTPFMPFTPIFLSRIGSRTPRPTALVRLCRNVCFQFLVLGVSSPDEPHLSSNFDAIRATHGNNCRSLAGVILRSFFCDIYSWACSAILPLGSWFSTQLLLFQILDYSIDIYPLKPLYPTLYTEFECFTLLLRLPCSQLRVNTNIGLLRMHLHLMLPRSMQR